jgi:hypothetical protein
MNENLSDRSGRIRVLRGKRGQDRRYKYEILRCVFQLLCRQVPNTRHSLLIFLHFRFTGWFLCNIFFNCSFFQYSTTVQKFLVISMMGTSFTRFLLFLCVAAISLHLVIGVPTPTNTPKAPAKAKSLPSVNHPAPAPAAHQPQTPAKNAVPKVAAAAAASHDKSKATTPKPAPAAAKPQPPAKNAASQVAATHDKSKVAQPKTAPGAPKPNAAQKPVSPNGKPTNSGKTFNSYADAVKHGQPAAAANAKEQQKPKPGKLPRCPYPRSKGSKINKRAPLDCEEWDDTNLKMTGPDHPQVAEENPNHSFFGKTWKYTDAGRPANKQMGFNRAKEMAKDLAQAQRQHYNQLESSGQQPWSKDKHPGAAGIQVHKDAFGPGVHEVKGATSMFKKPNAPTGVAPKLHDDVENLRKETGARRFPATSGAHVEEVTASQRAHEGKQPFKDTWTAVYDTEHIANPHTPSEPMHACKGNCGKIVAAGDGQDLLGSAEPTTKQKQRAQEKKAKKAAKAGNNAGTRAPSARLSAAQSQSGMSAGSSQQQHLDQLLGEETSSSSGNSEHKDPSYDPMQE